MKNAWKRTNESERMNDCSWFLASHRPHLRANMRVCVYANKWQWNRKHRNKITEWKRSNLANREIRIDESARQSFSCCQENRAKWSEWYFGTHFFVAVVKFWLFKNRFSAFSGSRPGEGLTCRMVTKNSVLVLSLFSREFWFFPFLES